MLVNNVRVFVPRSQATLRHGEDYTALVKTNVRLKMKQCEGRHIVGSIREVLAAENDAKREEFWANVEIGKQYTGVVKSLTNYGAFVDIGGVDGLVHISELSWNRIKHPSEVVSVGDTIDVYVKDIDTENKKVSLGYKKAEDNPWEKIQRPNIPSQRVQGARGVHHQVRRICAHPAGHRRPGCISVRFPTSVLRRSPMCLSVGQEVEVKLTDVDSRKSASAFR